MEKYRAYYNGKWIETDEHTDAVAPADLQKFAQVPALKPAHIDDLFEGSKNAFKDWGRRDYKERIAFLEKVAALMEKNAEPLAELLSKEVAKRISDARTEVLRTVKYIRQTNEEYAKLAQNPLHFDEKRLETKGLEATFYRVPLGVALCIAPYNYPVNLALAKIAPALVAGNTVAFKPATQGAATGVFIARLFDEAGLPPGVFNLITGRGRDIGDYCITHKNVALINFTGSTPVGKNIAKLAPGKPLILELGGKDFAIVRDDADLVKAAKEIVVGGFSYSGQRCTAIKRVFVTLKNKAELERLIVENVKALTVGLPAEDAFITPLIDVKGAEYVQSLIDDAIARGGKVLTGNKREKNLLWPTVVTDVSPLMKLAWEEPFGPVLPIMLVKDDDHAIELSNQSEYGLQGSIFTTDINAAKAMAALLETGSVNINRCSARGPDIMPFLGVKDSGFNVQGILDSILAMTRYKGVVIKK